MHIVPHAWGMILVVICLLMPYTAQPKGASVFTNLPLREWKPFVRGIYLSLWMPAAILHLCLLGPCIVFWGMIHGVLFLFFSMALISVYAGLAILLIEGLPFTLAFKPSRVKDMQAMYLVAMLPIFIFAAIQWLVFHYVFLVLVAAIALVLLACGIGYFSLRSLENKVRANLTLLGLVPSEMFKELE
jgi:hypothetical protein